MAGRGPNKSLDQQLADMDARYAKLQAQKAREDAESCPEVAEIVAEIEILTERAGKDKVALSDSSTSASYRFILAKKRLQIASIEAQESAAILRADYARVALPLLNSALTSTCSAISAGEEVDVDVVEILDSVQGLREQYSDAEAEAQSATELYNLCKLAEKGGVKSAREFHGWEVDSEIESQPEIQESAE